MKYRTCEKCAASVGTVNVIGNILMIAIKGYMGVAGRSRGLIADAIHSSADLMATIVMIIGLRVSEKKRNPQYPYGFGKAEYIVAIIIYLFLFVVGIYIVCGGAVAIIERRVAQPCLMAAWGAIFSIAINELMFRQTVCAGSQISSPSMVAKAWESRSDVYSSVAVLLGIIGARLGFWFMDPLAAAIVGIIILKISVEMVWEAMANLMDKAWDDPVVADIGGALDRMEKVSDVTSVVAREFGKYLDFEIELAVSPDLSMVGGEKVKREAKRIVSDFLKRKAMIRVRLVGGGAP